MKKLSLLLATAAVGLSAYAADSYKLHGQITGNTNWESVALTENNGKWEYTGKFVAGEFGIQVYDSKGDQTGWIAAPKGQATVNEADHAYATASSNTDNFSSTLTGNYTFSFDPAASTVTFITYSGEISEVVTYELRGTIVNGAWNDYAMTEGTDGNWSVKLNTVAGDFGIKRLVNGSQKDWYAADGANTIAEAGDYQAKVNGTNWKSTLTGEYTFTFNPTTLMLTVSGEGGDEPGPIDPPATDYTKWYVNVIGIFNDWTDNGVNPNEEGIATHNGLKLGTGEFRIKCWTGTADLSFSTGSTVPVGEWVKLTDTSGKGMTIANGTADAVYNVEFNCATSEVKITLVGGGDPNPPTPPAEVTYVLHGNWDGGESWSDLALTESNGVWAVSDVEISACNFGIKEMEGKEQKAWISSAADNATVELNTPMNCKDEGNNFSIAAGKYSFSFDPEAMTLTVTGKASDDPEPPTPGDDFTGWYCNLGGAFNGENDKWWYGVKVPTDGIVIFDKKHIYTDMFKIKVWNGESDTCYTIAGGQVPVGVEIQLEATTENDSNSEMHLVEPSATNDYIVTFDCNTNKMLVTMTSGVESIEVEAGEAVYFNLQGQRVENPENGLFVRVLNGKATKVMVK